MLEGRYRVIKGIGKGKFAEVYQVEKFEKFNEILEQQKKIHYILHPEEDPKNKEKKDDDEPKEDKRTQSARDKDLKSFKTCLCIQPVCDTINCWQAHSEEELRVPYPNDYGSTEDEKEKRGKLPDLSDNDLRLAREYLPFRKMSEKINWYYTFTKKYAAKVENASSRIMAQRPKYIDEKKEKAEAEKARTLK